MGIFSKLKGKFSKSGAEELEHAEDYIELGPESGKEGSAKVVVRPFTLEVFEDVKPVLDSLREGYTIALVNIRPLKDKDLVELKRSVNKLKKTVDAIGGDIAGFGDDMIVIAPGFAQIYRSSQTAEVKNEGAKEE